MAEGHRKRLRNRFIKDGLDSFEEHNALELLLFYAIPRRDTNETAHGLIKRFGNLSRVLDAPYEELRKCEGLGENAACLLKLVPEFFRVYAISKGNSGLCIDGSDKAGKFLIPRFQSNRNECVYLLCLDAKSKLIDCRKLFEGSINAAQISIRKITEVALMFNASSVILAHNHISGIALPSVEDEVTTRWVFDVLRSVGVALLDHIIVADDDFVSMADNGFFEKIKKL